MHNKDTVYQWRRHYVRENKSNVFPTLTANMGTGGHNVPLILDDHKRIRKITPKECSRVQGFPEEFRLPEQERLWDLIGMYDPGSDNQHQLLAVIDKIRESRRRLEQQQLDLEQMLADLADWEARTEQEVRALADSTKQTDAQVG